MCLNTVYTPLVKLAKSPVARVEDILPHTLQNVKYHSQMNAPFLILNLDKFSGSTHTHRLPPWASQGMKTAGFRTEIEKGSSGEDPILWL